MTLKIQKKTILPGLFFLAGILYYISNIVFPYNDNLEIQLTSRMVPQILCGLWGVLCLVIIACSLKYIASRQFFLLFLAFLLLAIIYIPYPSGHLADNAIFVLKNYFSIICMFSLYSLFRYNRPFSTRLVFVLFFFQITYALIMLGMDKVIFLLGLSKTGSMDSNSGFILASCIPLCLFLPRKHLRLYVYTLIALACLYSGQRSAAAAMAVSLPFCFKYLNKSMRKKDWVLLLVILLAAIPVVIHAYDNLMERMSIDAERGTVGSGRSEFWAIVWNNFWDGDLASILLGNGTNSVVSVIEREYGLAIGAHNGWLDILYTFGILGVLIYGAIIFSLLFKGIKGFKIQGYGCIYIILFLILFVKCSTSHGYFGIYEIPFFTVIAILESRKNIKHENPDNRALQLS